MKTIKHALNTSLIILTLALSLIGCGKRTGSGPNVDVQFTNHTASAMRSELNGIGIHGLLRGLSLQNDYLGETPTIFQMKLVVFYMVEALNGWDNAGDAVRIWTSNKCDADLTLCGIDPAHSGQYVVDYFDFAQGSAAVNTQFKNYSRDTKESRISAGTYRYIRMDFSGKQYDGDTMPNLKFGTTEAHEVRGQNPAVLVELPEPLVLKDGESFTVDLAYDLTNRFYASGSYANRPAEVGVAESDRWTCAGQGAGVPCIVEPEFHPTVTKK